MSIASLHSDCIVESFLHVDVDGCVRMLGKISSFSGLPEAQQRLLTAPAGLKLLGTDRAVGPPATIVSVEWFVQLCGWQRPRRPYSPILPMTPDAEVQKS